MTLDELNQVDVNDPAQVKALQAFLRSRGYYSGKVDGNWGGGTIDGVKALRGDLQTQGQNSRDTSVANAETEKAKNSPLRIAQEAGPYAAGLGAGLTTGYGLARKNRAADKGLNDEVDRTLADKRANHVIAEKGLDRRMAARRWRSAGQAIVPALGFAGAELTRRYIKPNMEESARPYVDMAANAEQGFGVGAGLMVAKNAVGDVFGKDPVPLDTETALRTGAAEARGDPHTISNRSAATAAGEADRARDARLAGLRARTAAELRTEAKALGLPTSGLKDDLARRIASAPESSPAPSVARRAARGASKAMIPLAVGYGVYDALRSPAEAGQADVARYAADRLDPGGDTLASFSDAYEDYKRYAQSRGEQPIPERAFQRQLRSSNVGMARVGGADRITASIRPAEAATRVTAEGTSRATAAAAGGAAAAGTAGGMKLGSKLAGYVADAATKTPLGRVAMKTGARVLPVAGGVLAAYDIGNFVAESARPAPENDAFAEQYDRTHPRFDPDAVAMERAKARQAARMPMQSAASLELPTNIRPGSAVTADRQAAMNSDDFDAQLQAFYAAIDDHNAGLGETYGP
jgi:hypothetical protein